jgi:hypothetical protein
MIVTQRQLDCTLLFVAAGYSLAGAAAWTGGFIGEDGVGLMTKFRFKRGMQTDHGSESLGQWRLDRLDGPNGLIAWCGRNNLDPETLEGAVAFAIWECGKFYPELDRALRAGGDVVALVLRITKEYERPNLKLPAVQNDIYGIRIPHAQEVLRRLHLIKDHETATQTVKSASKGASIAVGVGAAAAAVNAWHGIPTPFLWAFSVLVIGVLVVLSFRSEAAKRSALVAEEALRATPVAHVPGPAAGDVPSPVQPTPPALVLSEREELLLSELLKRLSVMLDRKFLYIPPNDDMDQAFGPVTQGV